MDRASREALRILDHFAALPKPSGSVTLSDDYRRAIARWEALPENRPGSDKSWVGPCQGAFEAHFASATPRPQR